MDLMNAELPVSAAAPEADQALPAAVVESHQAGPGSGKQLPAATYLHRSLVQLLAPEIREAVERAQTLAGLAPDAFNVVKLSNARARLSLLAYPGFDEEAFPILAAAWTVDLELGRVAFRSYSDTENPPVLHRKEELLPAQDPRRVAWSALTLEAERAGLFDDPAAIGTLWQWQETLRARRLRVVGHRLLPLGSGTSATGEADAVFRHRTAIRRVSLSTPLQAFARHGYLDGRFTVFDYGCGLGDDVARLRARGRTASGWDPYFAPDEPLQEADLVNLGFVLNVIEDPVERRAALLGAWSLARRLLVVAVLVGARTAAERYRLFRDGVLTVRGTFQKYFEQEELRDYLEESLGRQPIALAPGCFFVFRTDADEQEFLAARPTRQRLPLDTAWREARGADPRPRRPSPPHRRSLPNRRCRPRPRWAQHEDLLDALWQRILELGRLPEADEFTRTAELQAVGKPAQAFRYLLQTRCEAEFTEAQALRRQDLIVYLGLNLFEKRRSFSALPPSVQRDIKTLWGSYQAAQQAATSLLFSLGRPGTVAIACRQSAAEGIGWLDRDHALFVHASLLGRLPSILRLFVGCAVRLSGGLETADLIKLHMQSSKVTLLRYDDFAGQAIPLLVERIKVDLRRQSLDFFAYDSEERPPQPLYLRGRYLPEGFPDAAEQRAFDTCLEKLGLFDLSGFGPDLATFETVLAGQGLQIDGFKLVGGPEEVPDPKDTGQSCSTSSGIVRSESAFDESLAVADGPAEDAASDEFVR
mgnify:CR=1 FL=1